MSDEINTKVENPDESGYETNPENAEKEEFRNFKEEPEMTTVKIVILQSIPQCYIQDY